MAANDFIGPFSSKTYRDRRTELFKRLRKEDSDFVALVWSGSELIRNQDSHYPFRAHSNFLYLTGFSEPESLLILRRVNGKEEVSLALRPRDLGPERGSEIWEGERLGVDRAAKTLGLDTAVDIQKIDSFLGDQLKGASSIFWDLGQFPTWDQKLARLMNRLSDARVKGRYAHRLSHLGFHLGELRKKKSGEEIKLMRKSAEIAAEGHKRAMAMIKPGVYEYQVAAETEREFKMRGAESVAYSSICATGQNACTLHYRLNTARAESGEVFLMDAGAEYSGYASDITRSFPVTGQFTKAQAEVYDWVLKAQQAAIKAVKPGAAWNRPHEAAIEVIAEALRALKLIKAPTKKILKDSLWRAFMPHGTSHWLGLDVHDIGLYYDELGQPFKLQEGNVLTIEPGLYFSKNDKRVPAALRGLGIRIEDDVAVSSKGADVLSTSCPKTREEMEDLRA